MSKNVVREFTADVLQKKKIISVQKNIQILKIFAYWKFEGSITETFEHEGKNNVITRACTYIGERVSVGGGC